jgi:hypothetical protein
MARTNFFDVEFNGPGAHVVVVRQPLTRDAHQTERRACMKLLKEDLDVVAAKTKKAIREQSAQRDV